MMCGYYESGYGKHYNVPRAPKGLIHRVQSMSEVLPENFESWERKLFVKLMFYEKINKKTAIGYCECGAHVEIKPMRSGSIITCPQCGEQVRVTYSSGIVQRRFVTYIDSLGDGWVCRMFVSEKLSHIIGDKISVTYIRTEEQRDWLGRDDNDVISYHPARTDYKRLIKGRGRVHGTGYTGWIIDEKPLCTYPHNLSRLFNGSVYEHAALDIACEKSHVDPLAYLLQYKRKPKLEVLYKFGLYKVAEQMIDDYNSVNAHRLMERVKSPKDLGIYTADDLEQCQRLSVEQIMARKEIKKWDISKAEADLANLFIATLNRRCGEDMRYSFITRQGWFKYYLTQSAEYPKITNFIADYTDYISECITLKLNVNDTLISKPHSLKVAHERTSREVKIIVDKEKDRLILDVCNRLKKRIEWSNGIYCVIMPRSAAEIIAEGKRQQHCVGGYCDRVASGASVIVFVRREEAREDNYYTAELKPNGDRFDIVQVRGARNICMNKEVGAFMKLYEKRLNSRTARTGQQNQN